MRRPNPNNYKDIKGELMRESFLADLALYHLDRYDAKKVPLLHMAVAAAAWDAMEVADKLNATKKKKSRGKKP